MALGTDVLWFLSLTAAGIVAGAQFFGLVSVIPALKTWPGEHSASVHQEVLTHRPHRWLRVIGAVAIAPAVALLGLLVIEDENWPTITLLALGVVAALLNAGTSGREWKINEEINSWGRDPQLDRYAELRPLWDAQHLARTSASLFAFAAFVVAVVVSDTS